jgi:shikimate dehydrogenase
VTLPFKGEAAEWVDSLDPLAAFARAVNTIVPDPAGGYRGFNTDGPGLVNDLRRLLGDVADLRVLLIGAGGAASGVVRPLLETLAAELVIANRTPAKAEALAGLLRQDGGSNTRGVALEEVAESFDLVINATSAGLHDQVPAIAPTVVEGACCYDLVYGGMTAFRRWAEASGARESHDGLGMLVEQAALAFELWRGVLPDTGPVLSILEAEGGN